MRRAIAIVAVVSAGLGHAPLALAQDAAGDKVNQLIIYGNDACPPAKDDEIVICARKEEAERFRIPAILRESSSPANEAWTQRVIAYEMVGKSGTMSCSPSGAGGWTGCTGKLINAAYAEKRASSDVKFSELIAAERERRLSTIDAEAAETQARVEQLEQDYEARRKAAEAAEAAATQPSQQPKPD